MNFNAPNCKEHLKEYLTKFFFKKDIPVFFIYEKYTLSIDFYVKKMTSYLFKKKILKNLPVKPLLLLR